MNPKLDRGFLSVILASLVVLGIPSCVCQDQLYQNCSRPFQCGRFIQGYPFWGGNRPASCGYPGFELDCQDGVPLFTTSSVTYRVLDIDNRTQTLRVSRNDLWENLCPRLLFETTLNFSTFNYNLPANYQNITLYYGCPPNPQLPPALVPNQFDCNVNGTSSLSFYLTRDASELGISITCNRQIHVPVNRTSVLTLTSTTLLQASLQSGFRIQWSADNQSCDDCVQSGGLCGYNQDSASFACHCTNGTFQPTCNGRQIVNGSRNGNGNGSGNNGDGMYK